MAVEYIWLGPRVDTRCRSCSLSERRLDVWQMHALVERKPTQSSSSWQTVSEGERRWLMLWRATWFPYFFLRPSLLSLDSRNLDHAGHIRYDPGVRDWESRDTSIVVAAIAIPCREEPYCNILWEIEQAGIASALVPRRDVDHDCAFATLHRCRIHETKFCLR
jgi:hypothetical protein